MKNDRLLIKPTFSRAGFTLIEVLVVVAMFSTLAGMTAFFNLSFYKGSSFTSDYDAFIAVLQRVRAKAISNINESNHGLYIDADKYILFEGDSYLTATDTQDISRNSNITITGASEIVFSQLSGDSNFNGILVLTEGTRTATVSLNNEGRID